MAPHPLASQPLQRLPDKKGEWMTETGYFELKINSIIKFLAPSVVKLK